MTHFLVFSLLAAGSFGAEGTIVPGGSIVLSHSNSPFDNDGSFTNLYLAPELTYFALENLAFGAGLNFGISAAPGFINYTYGIQPIVGYYVPVSDSIGLFPKVSLLFSKYHLDSDVPVLGTSGGYSASSWSFRAGAPMLFHFGNFFLGFGPQFDRQLESGYWTIAFVSSIGGSF